MAEIEQAVAEIVRRVVRQELRGRDIEWDWLTAERAGQLLGISKRAVLARIRRGTLPGVKTNGRVYVRRSALDRMLSGADN